MQTRDSIVELKETKIFISLQKQSDEYANRICKFVQGVAPILATTCRFFPYYTRHDAHHGFRVTRRIEQIVDSECFQLDQAKSLGSAELFLLIAAAYAHDLGMSVFPGEEDGLTQALGLNQTAGWEINPVLQKHLRHEHSKRGGAYIMSHADELGVPINLVGALDLMMKSHNYSISDLEREISGAFAAQERPIDVKQLAIIVCVADAMEFSDTRVVDGVLDKIKLDPSDEARVSYRENMKHVCIGDSVAVKNAGQVIVNGTFSATQAEVLGLAHRTFDEIEEWIRGYCDIDKRSPVRRLKVSAEPFIRNLTFMGGRFERLGVRLNKKNVIDLIASNAVWRSHGGVAIRELVQNAVEACRYRAHHSSQADKYIPKVSVIFNRTENTIVVSDNGCGMSERTILNNFLTVGSSRAKESAYSGTDYAPIARFGVGFWSVFTVAESAQIQTAAFEDHRGKPDSAIAAKGVAFDVALDELKDYTVFASITQACGTTITLSLKSGIVMDDVFAEVQQHLLCAPVALHLVFDGDETQIPTSVPEVTDFDVFGARQKLKEDFDIRLFQWDGSKGQTELSLGFAYRMVNGKASFLYDPNSSLLQVLSGIKRPKTAVCGFSVPLRPNALCFDLTRVGLFASNHRTPSGFEYAIDRQQLLANSASQNYSQDVTDLIHDGYRAFLDFTGTRNPEAIVALREQAAMHGGNVYDTFTGTELADACTSFPDLQCFRLHEVDTNRSFETAVVHHVDLHQLQKMSGSVLFMQNRHDRPAPGGGHYSFYSESVDATRFVYECGKSYLKMRSDDERIFVAEADRNASMLFDGDPDSTVLYAQVPAFGDICIQRANLSKVQFSGAPRNVLAEIQGRWAGAVYLREFTTPNNKPYVFLGRHRVLILKSSRLAVHLQGLTDGGRRVKLAEVIHCLTEDQAGFTPAAIAALI
jgi:Histidine kinase-, DNA gyrase B-, and HSP90-like ATPase